MSKTHAEKVDELRTVVTLLWTEHQEMQEFNRETYGERDFNADEATTFSTAALALEKMVDMLEGLLDLTAEDFTCALMQGAPISTAKTYTMNVLQIIDEQLA